MIKFTRKSTVTINTNTCKAFNCKSIIKMLCIKIQTFDDKKLT